MATWGPFFQKIISKCISGPETGHSHLKHYVVQAIGYTIPFWGLFVYHESRRLLSKHVHTVTWHNGTIQSFDRAMNTSHKIDKSQESQSLSYSKSFKHALQPKWRHSLLRKRAASSPGMGASENSSQPQMENSQITKLPSLVFNHGCYIAGNVPTRTPY